MAGYFISNTLYKSRVALNTVTVKGLAERRVEADQVNWRISYSVTGKSRDDIPELYKQAENNKDQILKSLEKGGITQSEITIGTIKYSSDEFRNDDKELVDQRHYLTGTIEIETTRVPIVGKVRPTINELMIQGIDLSNFSPKYRFTKLNEIKPDMLQEATKNARIAAAEFATHSGSKIGRIRSARQGGFTIVDVGENYGDTNKIKKEVRVVTTSEFYLED